MSRRERVLLIAGSSLIVLLLFYYYILSPRQNEYDALRAQLADRRATLERMEISARQAPQLEAEFARLQATIAALESKLPTSKETAVLLVQLETMARDLQIDLTAVTPGPLEAPPAPQPAAGTTGPARPQAALYQRYPIKLAMTAEYRELLRLMNRFNTFPRLIVVRRLTVSPQRVPELSLTVDIETFVLPKEAR